MPGSFDASFGNVSDNPVTAILIALGAVLLIVLLARIFWRQLQEALGAREAGRRDPEAPKEYFVHSFLPSFLSWPCKLTVIGIFLAAFAIPVTFESVMWVTGSGSLANVVSVTPGAVGITQATNALALDTCCDVAKDTGGRLLDRAAADHDRLERPLFALVLVVSVFGWKGGKQLVTQSYADAKVKVAEQKSSDAEKKAAKKAASVRSPGKGCSIAATTNGPRGIDVRATRRRD